MAQQQNSPSGLVHGSYALSIPSGAGALRQSSSKKSGSQAVQKQAFDISDFIETPGNDLTAEIDAFDSRVSDYFNMKTNIELAEADVNIALQATFDQYGGNFQEFWKNEQGTVHNATAKVIQERNRVQQYHALAQKEMSEFKESDLYQMAPGTPLYDAIGNRMRSDDVLKGEALVTALDRERNTTLAYLGIDGKDPEVKNLKGEQLLNYIAENKNPFYLNKEARIAMQDLLPLGYGFDDVMALDIGEYYAAMEELAKMHGTTKVGEDGDRYVVTMDSEQIGNLIQQFHENYVPNDPTLQRNRSVMLNNKADERAYNLRKATQIERDGYNNAFTMLSDIKDQVGIESFDEFLLGNTGRIIDLVKADETLTEQQKAQYEKLLSNRLLVENSLLFANAEESIITSNAKGQIFLEEQMRDEITALSSYYKIPRGKEFKYAAGRLIRLAQTGKFEFPVLASPYRKVVDGTGVKIADDYLAGNAAAYTLSSDRKVDRAMEYVATQGNKLDEMKFWSDNGYQERISPYLIKESKGDILDKFITALTKNPKILQGETFVEIHQGTISGGIDRGIDRRSGPGVAGKVGEVQTKYDAGIQVSGKHGFILDNIAHMDWGSVMRHPDFQKWAKENLSTQEQKQLWSVDNYIAAAVGPSAEQDIGDKIIMEASKGGTIDIIRQDITSMNEYSPYIGEYSGAGDVYYYDPVTRQKELMKSGFFVAGEKSIGLGFGGKNELYTETMVVVSEDDLEKYGWTDREGKEHKYHEIYGDVDKYSVASMYKSGRPEIREYLKALGRFGITESLKAEEDAFEGMYMIPFWLIRDKNFTTEQWAENRKVRGAEIDETPKSLTNAFSLKYKEE